MSDYDFQLIGEISKNRRDTVRVTLRTFKGYDLIDVRVWYEDTKTGELKPSPKGISLKLELLPELLEVLGKIGDAHAQTSVCSNPA